MIQALTRIRSGVGPVDSAPSTSTRSPVVRRHSAALLAALLLSTAPLLGACAPPAMAEDSNLHGAAPMAQQEAALDKLLVAPRKASGAPDTADETVWKALVPAGNEMTPERIALGRELYFDLRLSADGTVSCATCHDVTRSFTDRRPVSEGIRGQLGRRNAPTTMNAALMGSMFLDGRAATLEEQALMPIVNPIEMGQPDGASAVAAIADDPEYKRMFQAAYGRSVNYDDIGRAIAVFERTLIFMKSPFDRFLKGEREALSPAALAGWALYNGKARCVTCHPINLANPLGSDDRFHNIGVAARNRNFESLAREAREALEADDTIERIDQLALETDASELGRFLISKSTSDIGAFRTPQLRNIGITGPYMHDGSMQTLWDVMDHYNKGGEANLYLDGGIEPLALTEAEIEQLVAFMFALTDERFSDLNQEELERQYELAQKQRPFRDEDLAFRRTFAFSKGTP